MPNSSRLIISTNNKGKLTEICQILQGIPLPVVGLCDIGWTKDLPETGKTFLENALQKTLPVSLAYPNDYVVGEDAGLEVEALFGEPGVYSKRYAGKLATDQKNNAKLLRQLSGLTFKKRKACFSCILTLMKAGKLVKAFSGKLCGYINDKPAGESGFGYDPIFYASRYKKTTAQLTLPQKNLISHRGKAFRKLKNFFLRHLRHKKN